MDSGDKHTIERLRDGDHGAYRSLFDVHYIRLCNLAYKVLGDMDLARGCVQSVWVKLYEKRDHLNIQVSIDAYLNRMVINAALNLKNKRAGMHTLDLEDNAGHEQHQDLMEQAEEEARIWREIEALPEQCKRIFLMNRFEGLSNDEIAEALGLSKRTVETQVSNALRKLKNKLLIFFTLSL